jgi:hypothetical protein
VRQPNQVEAELEALDGLWEGGLEAAYIVYQAATDRSQVALAAALVEVALQLQRLGGPAAAPPDLLRGDLCLARASRLLADAGDQRLQIAFARAIEEAGAAAAAGEPVPPVRRRLLEAVRS